jgi:hypothetical protein
VNTSAKLTDEDVPSLDHLASVHLHTTPLTRTVTTVPTRSLSFLVSHGLSSQVNSFDLHSREVLPVSTSTAVILAPFFLEHQDLFLFPVLDDASGNRSATNEWSPNLHRPIC